MVASVLYINYFDSCGHTMRIENSDSDIELECVYDDHGNIISESTTNLLNGVSYENTYTYESLN